MTSPFKLGDLATATIDPDDLVLGEYNGQTGQIVALWSHKPCAQVYFEGFDAYVDVPLTALRLYQVPQVDTRPTARIRD